MELGITNISCIIKQRRVKYLYYLVKTDKVSMLHKFFQAMLENPTKDDWTESVLQDLVDFDTIKADLQALGAMAKSTFKNLVKTKGKEFTLDRLNQKKFEHSKMENLVYTELKTQDYLLSTDITTEQKRQIFLFRTRMADFSENY